MPPETAAPARRPAWLAPEPPTIGDHAMAWAVLTDAADEHAASGTPEGQRIAEGLRRVLREIGHWQRSEWQGRQ